MHGIPSWGTLELGDFEHMTPHKFTQWLHGEHGTCSMITLSGWNEMTRIRHFSVCLAYKTHSGSVSVYSISPVILVTARREVLQKLSTETPNLWKGGPLQKWWLPGEDWWQGSMHTPFQAPWSEEVVITEKLQVGLSVRCWSNKFMHSMASMRSNLHRGGIFLLTELLCQINLQLLKWV